MRWFALVLLVACGDNRGAYSYDEYAAAWEKAFCRRALFCGTLASEAECTQRNVGVFRANELYADAIRAGHILWDAEAAFACLEGSIERSCDTTSEDYRAYRCEIARGTLHDGEGCLLDDECISRECWNEGCENACCAGVCVGQIAPVPAAIGEPCRTAPCLEGWCDGGVCQPFLEEGAPCDERDGPSCAYGLACLCATGFSCAETCAPLPARGEACTTACSDAGDWCKRTPDRPWRCVPLPRDGDPCVIDEDCGAAMRCDAMRCRPRNAALGEPCSDARDCGVRGALCSWGTRTCILPLAAGEPCSLWTECESLICDYGVGVCADVAACWTQ